MEASPDPCRPSCRAAGGEGEQLGMLRSGSGPWVPGTSIGGHGASTGAFWPEEVTEKWVGASESPRNSRRGQTLLLLRAGRILAFLQRLPGHGPAPELSAAQAATRSSGGPMALPSRCSQRGKTSSGSWLWPPAASAHRGLGSGCLPCSPRQAGSFSPMS